MEWSEERERERGEKLLMHVMLSRDQGHDVVWGRLRGVCATDLNKTRFEVRCYRIPSDLAFIRSHSCSTSKRWFRSYLRNLWIVPEKIEMRLWKKLWVVVLQVVLRRQKIIFLALSAYLRRKALALNEGAFLILMWGLKNGRDGYRDVKILRWRSGDNFEMSFADVGMLRATCLWLNCLALMVRPYFSASLIGHGF